MNSYFPTKFASKLAHGSGICKEVDDVFFLHEEIKYLSQEIDAAEEKIEEYEEDENYKGLKKGEVEHLKKIKQKFVSKSRKKYLRKKSRLDNHMALIDFQNLSITTDLDGAMIAFDGIELNEEQKEVLGKIHSSTFNWIKGKVIEKIMGRIEDTSNTREIRDLTETIMSIVGEDSDSGISSKISAYIVNTQ